MKLSPERRSEATQRRPTDNGEDRSEATLRAGTGALFIWMSANNLRGMDGARLLSASSAPLRRTPIPFFVYTQGYAAVAAPPWAITLSPRVAGLRIPLAYARKFPHHPPFNFRFIGLFVCW